MGEFTRTCTHTHKFHGILELNDSCDLLIIMVVASNCDNDTVADKKSSRLHSVVRIL